MFKDAIRREGDTVLAQDLATRLQNNEPRKKSMFTDSFSARRYHNRPGERKTRQAWLQNKRMDPRGMSHEHLLD